jgi:hypothetical protein
MASQPLVLTDPNLLAEFVRESEFSTFFEKRFAAPPDLAALLFRDGQLIDAYKGAHFSVGGITEAIKGLVVGSHHIAIMLADLKPFQVSMPLKAMSKDNVEIAGLVTLDLQLNPEKPGNILGLMGGVARQEKDAKPGEEPTGRKALSRFDVLERIRPHFTDRVIEATIGRVYAEEIRGNVGLQDKLQADMMTLAERICGDIGIMVRSTSIEWAMNAVEREQFARAEVERQQAALDYQLELMKREVERQGESTKVKIEANVDLTRLQQASQDELAHMVLESEVRFIDARVGNERRQEMEALQHEIQVLRVERAGRFENELSEAGQVIDLTKEQARLRLVERDIELLDTRHLGEMKKIGAFSDMEIKGAQERLTIALNKEGLNSELDVTERAQAIARANLAGVNQIETVKADSDAERRIKEGDAETRQQIDMRETDTRARVEQLKAGATMTPEQILAINAGIEPHVAEVLKEQARAQATAQHSSMEIMRQLIDEARADREAERAQTLDVLKAGMAGASGVAHGAGGKDYGHIEGEPGAETLSPTRVECPKCGKVLMAKANFCTGCGHQMRT